MKYIDAEKLKEKIEKKYLDAKEKARFARETGTSSDCTKWNAIVLQYENVLRIIASLQQAQPKFVNEIWHDVTETPSIFGLYLVIHEKGWCVANYMGKGIVCESGWVEAIHHIEIEHPQKWLDLMDLIPKKQ